MLTFPDDRIVLRINPYPRVSFTFSYLLRMIRVTLILIILAFTAGCASRETGDGEKEVLAVLNKQQGAWNKGDIDAFMEGYWKSDSLLFIGSSVQKGWQQTIERYRKSYPTPEAMGRLQFEIRSTEKISAEAYLVSGTYTLFRASDQPTGPFTLLFRKKNNRWVIVYDHTC